MDIKLGPIHVHIHDDATNDKLDHIIALLKAAAEREKRMAGELNALISEVGELRTVNDSILALTDGLAAKLDEAIAAGDMTQVVAATEALKAERTRIAEAVVRNTRPGPQPQA